MSDTARPDDTARVPVPTRSAASDLPWDHDGLCPGKAGSDFETRRREYLATFVPEVVWQTTVYVHPFVLERPAAVVDGALGVVRTGLEDTHRWASSFFGLACRPAVVYVYPSLEALREHSCVSANADAYYDGAIHLAVTETGTESDREARSIRDVLRKSLRHEYAHHVLVKNGIGKPMWFQEGAAMAFARDFPHDHYQVWRQKPLDARLMVGAFPKTAPPGDAAAFYAQASVMMDFLDRLCLTRPACRPAELVEALMKGRATPETLFDWAISRRGSDLFSTSRLPLWDDYTQHGDFPPETKKALLRRALPDLP